MTNAPKYAIDKFLTEDIQAIFGIIIMPATVMGLVAQFLIHPYLNQIFELYKNGNLIKLKKLLYRIIASILINFFISIIVMNYTKSLYVFPAASADEVPSGSG